MKKNNSNKKFKKILAFVCACIMCFIVMFFVLLSAFKPLIIFGADEPTDEPSAVPVVRHLFNTEWFISNVIVNVPRVTYNISGLAVENGSGRVIHFDSLSFGISSSDSYDDEFVLYYDGDVVKRYDTYGDSLFLEFAGGTDETNSSLISNLYTIGQLQMVTDLSGSIWYIPAVWNCDAGFGSYTCAVMINGSSNVETQRLNLGYQINDSGVRIESQNYLSMFDQYGNISNYYGNQNLTIEFLGIDKSNLSSYSSLIYWLYSYGYMTKTPDFVVPDDERIDDLTGSTWIINEDWSALAGYGSFDVDVLVGFVRGYGLEIGYREDHNSGGLTPSADYLLIEVGDQSYLIQDNTGFSIKFEGGSDVLNPLLIDWLYSNGILFDYELPDEPEEPQNYIFGEFIRELKPFVNFDPINSDDVSQTYNYEFYSLDGKYYNQIEVSCVKKLYIDPRKYDFNLSYKNTTTNESILVYSAEYIYDSTGPEFIHYNDNFDAIYNFYRFIQFRDGLPILNVFLTDNLILMDFDGDELYFLGYNQGHLDTYQPAYDKGYQDGFMSDLLGDTLEGPIDALDSVILFTSASGVTITIWTVLNAVIGLSLFIWFMKMFSGG